MKKYDIGDIVYLWGMCLLTFLIVQGVVWGSDNKILYIQDRYGNTVGSVQHISKKSAYEHDKHGNFVRSYHQVGNIVYIYDKYGNCVGSYRK